LCIHSCAWCEREQFIFYWQPKQWPGQAEHGLAQEDADQKEQAQGLASIRIGAEAYKQEPNNW
jgi:hypothetical protein